MAVLVALAALLPDAEGRAGNWLEVSSQSVSGLVHAGAMQLLVALCSLLIEG